MFSSVDLPLPRATNADELTGLHPQIDLLEHVDGTSRTVVVLDQVLYVNQ
jgi:hypothetical protein